VYLRRGQRGEARAEQRGKSGAASIDGFANPKLTAGPRLPPPPLPSAIFVTPHTTAQQGCLTFKAHLTGEKFLPPAEKTDI